MQTVPLRISETIEKIHELAEYRERYIRKTHQAPNFKRAATRLGVSADEVHSYAPDLYMEWYDAKFHWKLPKEQPFH